MFAFFFTLMVHSQTSLQPDLAAQLLKMDDKTAWITRNSILPQFCLKRGCAMLGVKHGEIQFVVIGK